jgi:Protein kinase domain
MREWSVPGYTEVRVLGSGGFGEVVLARHDVSGALVAVKYLRHNLLDDREFVDLFRAEARVLASLEDPNVVRLYEYVESPSGAAIVMELVDGVSLREILARQGATTAEAALVVLQGSLVGLAAAHARGVVHRDYKPENVLVDGAGVSKLTDFGIAARAGDRAIAAGTLAYAPPEQFSGGPASPAGDVYAATATFYECLAGHPPFTGGTTEVLLAQHRSEAVPLEPVPGPLRPLVTVGMAKNPQARPADAAAFVTQLRAAAVPAYGRDWEDRGRSHLGEAALLLAALWPSGTAPAVQGQAVEQVHLAKGPRGPQEPEHARNLEHLRHVEHTGHLEHERVEHLEHEHVEHVEHVEHLEHLEHLGQSPQGHSGSSTQAAAEGAEPAAGVAGAAGAAGVAASAAGAASSPDPAASPATGLRRLARYSRKALSAGHGAGAIALVVALAALITGIALASGGGGSSLSASGRPVPTSIADPAPDPAADPAPDAAADPAADPAPDPGPSAPCVFAANHGDCTSSDPEITLQEVNKGNTSGCMFSVQITWGDGSQQTVQYQGADGVPSVITSHTYQQPGTFSISDSPTVLSGTCSATGDDYTFAYS